MQELIHIDDELIRRSLRDKNDPKEIFYYYIRQLVRKGSELIYLQAPRHQKPVYFYFTNGQAASLIFGNGQDGVHLITRMLGQYREFFEFDSTGRLRKFRPAISLIREHHPGIFSVRPPQIDDIGIQQEIIQALKDEIRSFNESTRKNYVDLYGLTYLTTVKGIQVYSARCFTDSDDQVIQLPEGLKVRYKNHGFITYVTILQFDSRTSKVIFQTSRKLPSGGRPRLENNPWYLISNLIKSIERIDLSSHRFRNLFRSAPDIIYFPDENIPPLAGNLDVSQQEAVRKSITQPVTYIWGPPGTGKSYTLASLLLALFMKGERTLVCSIANVAVNGLAMKLVAAIKKQDAEILKRGEILRIGYVGDKDLLEVEELFPEDDVTLEFRSRIQVLEEEIPAIDADKNRTTYARKLSELEQAKHQLANHLRERIENARIIFTTSSKALMEESISEANFDNLVIDEGSMMSPPILLALSSKVTKRIVVAGDHRQLGPIALSNTALSDRWLHSSLFDLLGTGDIASHEAVSMLKLQRRCAKPIIELVNTEFYGGQLDTLKNDRQSLCYEVSPRAGNVTFVDLGKDEDYAVARTGTHSRYNEGSLEYVMCLLGEYDADGISGSVGIIAPYRAQVLNYQKAVEEFVQECKPNFEAKVGTIHSFQGSECDIIIFDMVDGLFDTNKSPIRIGNLYYGKDGERLVNVALSRAISKLVVVGCSKVLWEGMHHGQVSTSVKRIIDKCASYRVEI